MKIELTRIGHRCIKLNLPISSTFQEWKEWQQVQYQVLIYAYWNQPAYLVTLAPQKYSLGYDLNNPAKLKIGKDNLLVNYIEACSEDLLQEVRESEEFRRGLLRLITIDANRLQNIVGSVFFRLLDDSDIAETSLDYQLITCEDDGKSLYWFNPLLPVNEIKNKLDEIIGVH